MAGEFDVREPDRTTAAMSAADGVFGAYLLLTFLIVQGFSLLERRLSIHRRKATVSEMLAGMR